MQDTDRSSKQRCYLDDNANISYLNTTPFADQPATTATIRVECTTVQGEEQGALVIEGRLSHMAQHPHPISREFK